MQGCEGHHNDKLLPRGECQLWDLKTHKRVAALKGSGRAVLCVAFTPDGKGLLTGGEGKVFLYDTATQRQVAELPGLSGPVLALAVSPDGKTLAASAGNQVKLYDLGERKAKAVLDGRREGVRITGLAFVDEGNLLAASGTDGQTTLWDVAAGKWRTPLPAQPTPIVSLAATRDGQTLALGCADRLVRIVDVRTGQLRAVLPGHTREVLGVAFSNDRGFLVSAGTAQSEWYVAGGEIKVWRSIGSGRGPG